MAIINKTSFFVIIGLIGYSNTMVYANDSQSNQIKNAKPIASIVYEEDCCTINIEELNTAKDELKNQETQTTKKNPKIENKGMKTNNSNIKNKPNQLDLNEFSEIDPEKIYQTSCSACHLTGIANAPKLGDREIWQQKIETGFDKMVEAVVNGKGAMPPNAGNPKLTKSEISKTIEWMIKQ